MKVKNIKMYNIHKPNHHDELWVPGNIIHIDNNFRNDFLSRIPVKHNNSTSNAIANLESKLNYIDSFEFDSPEEGQAYVYNIINHLNQLKYVEREQALEEYRRTHCPNKLSRYNSIWVTDEKSLEYWKKLIEGEIFQVSLTGKIFKTYDQLMPSVDSFITYPQLVKASRKYWNPLFQKKESSKAEYLFQGELKVLKKLK